MPLPPQIDRFGQTNLILLLKVFSEDDATIQQYTTFIQNTQSEKLLGRCSLLLFLGYLLSHLGQAVFNLQ